MTRAMHRWRYALHVPDDMKASWGYLVAAQERAAREGQEPAVAELAAVAGRSPSVARSLLAVYGAPPPRTVTMPRAAAQGPISSRRIAAASSPSGSGASGAGVRCQRSYHLGRVDQNDPRVAYEVLTIERQQMRCAMGLHHCDQSRIVHLLTQDVLRGDEPQPVCEDRRRLLKQGELVEQALDLCLGQIWLPAEPIGLDGASRYSPELNQNLSREAETLSTRRERRERFHCEWMLRSRLVNSAKEYVRIQEIARHQS
jgi:hypothetical protein